ncbi:MAG: hypothetical protein NVSMB57_05180 [Actinomycetota bacterium]
MTPQCLSLVGSSVLSRALPAFPGCGVEGIALDESGGDPLSPLGLYVSTYNLDLLGNLNAPPVAPGGIFRSELPISTRRVRTAGLTWTELLPGVRGNALMVKRTGLGPATIVAGRIQKTSGDVGTDTNAWCPGSSCSPSLYVSYDDGATWSTRNFVGSPCPNGQGNVPTSSKLVGGLSYDHNNNNVFYAAANSGLWVSIDDGLTWKSALSSCGNSAGFALTQLAAPADARIYTGRNVATAPTSEIWSAPTGSAGPGAFSKLSLINAQTGGAFVLPGWVQSIVLDARDASERTMFVASWMQATVSGGRGGVYKIVDQGNGTATVTDLHASFLEPYRDCLNLDPPATKDCLDKLHLPYPLIFSPVWRPSLFLAQHPLEPDLIYASSVLGGVWTRSDGSTLGL